MAVDVVDLVKTALIGELEKLRDEVRKVAEPLTEAELWKKPLKWIGNIAIVGGLLGVFVHYLRFGPKIVPPDEEKPPQGSAPQQGSRP